MGKAVFLQYRDIRVAKQIRHSLDECRHEQRHVASCRVCDVDLLGQRLQAGAKAFERTAIVLFVTDHGNRGWQCRQCLPARGDDDQRGRHTPEQPDDPLEHGFVAEGQHRLGRAHSGGASAAQDDASEEKGSGVDPFSFRLTARHV